MKISKVFLILSLASLLVGVSEAQIPLRTEFFFPQIADGRLDDDEFRTIVVLSHPDPNGAATATVTLSLFLFSAGAPVDPPFSLRCLVVAEDGHAAHGVGGHHPDVRSHSDPTSIGPSFSSRRFRSQRDFVVGTVVVESDMSDIAAVALKFDDEPDEDEEGENRNEFTVAPVTQLAP